MKNFVYLCTTQAKNWEFSSAGSEHLPYKQRVGGSNPSTPTKNKNDQEFFLVVFCFLYINIPSPTPPFAKGKGLVADRACSKLSVVRLFSLMELELKVVAEIKYI